MLKKTTLVLAFLAVQSYACDAGVAETTVYYLPSAKEMCGSHTKCSKFVSAVKMQGSGILSPGVILKYTGKTTTYNDCNTTKGSLGDCLIPYISVAASKGIPFGTIISMPALKGKTMTLRDGRKFTHPGFLIVHDRGGAIKGSQRFDIYTDEMSDTHPTNTMGRKNTLNMADKTQCPDYKKFTYIKPSPNKDISAQSESYQKAYKAISDLNYLVAKGGSKKSSAKGQGVQ